MSNPISIWHISKQRRTVGSRISMQNAMFVAGHTSDNFGHIQAHARLHLQAKSNSGQTNCQWDYERRSVLQTKGHRARQLPDTVLSGRLATCLYISPAVVSQTGPSGSSLRLASESNFEYRRSPLVSNSI